MQDNPSAVLLAQEVRKALGAGIEPGFAQKVAANALGIVQRELDLAPAASTAEGARLERLVGAEGSLAERNRRLAEAIRGGTAVTDAMVAHLIATTLEKIAVDQPSYPAYRAWMDGQ